MIALTTTMESHARGVPAALVDTDIDVWRRVLAVNLDGTLLGIKTVAPSMLRGGARGCDRQDLVFRQPDGFTAAGRLWR